MKNNIRCYYVTAVIGNWIGGKFADYNNALKCAAINDFMGNTQIIDSMSAKQEQLNDLISRNPKCYDKRMNKIPNTYCAVVGEHVDGDFCILSLEETIEDAEAKVMDFSMEDSDFLLVYEKEVRIQQDTDLWKLCYDFANKDETEDGIKPSTDNSHNYDDYSEESSSDDY